MKLNIFKDTLNEAADEHNNALLSRRSENYVESLQHYSRALELYTKCLDFYKETEGHTGYLPTATIASSDNSSSRGSDGTSINLELKISQTLQSMAKLHSNFLHDDESAIKAHEDVISLLLLDPGLDGDENRRRDRNEATAVKSRQKSPSSVTQNLELESSLNIIRLTTHERVRVVSLSLSALGGIYFKQECEIPSYYQKIQVHSAENSLRYYEESLKILSSITEPLSTTSVSALAHSQEEAISSPPSSKLYTIDLRIDVINNLIDISMVYKHRGEFQCVVDTLEQARDLRLLSNCDASDQEMIESMLAMAYENIGDFDNSLFCLQHALRLRKQLFGDQSIQVANLYSSISNMHRKSGDYYQSLSWNKRANSLYEKFVHHDDSALELKCRRHLIESLQIQGVTFIEMLEFDDAIEAYSAVIKAQIEFIGEEHPDVAKTLNAIGTLYTEKMDYVKAQACLNRALLMYQKYGAGHTDPDMIETLKALFELDKILKEKDVCFGISEENEYSQRNELPQILDMTLPSPGHQRFGTIVETNGSFDDDTVSQITFVTNKEVIPSSLVTKSKKNYDYDAWAPAEYVFNAVNQLASAAEDFLYGHTLRRSKRSLKPMPPSDKESSKRQSELIKQSRRRRNEHLGRVKEVSEMSSPSTLSSKGKRSPEEPYRAQTTALLVKSQNANNVSMTDDQDDNSTLLGSAFISSILGYEDNSGSIPTRKCSTESKKQYQRPQTFDTNDDESTLLGARYASYREDEGSSLFDELNEHVPSSISSRGNEERFLLNDWGENEVTAISKQNALENQCESNLNRILDATNTGDAGKVNGKTHDVDSNSKDFVNFFDNEQELKDLSEEPSLLAEDYFERLSSCQDVLIDLRDKYGAEHTKVIEKTVELANLYIKSGNTEKGVSTFREVISLHQKKYGKNCVQAAESLVKMGQQLARYENYSEAIQALTEAKGVEITIFGSLHPRISRILNEIGLVYFSQEDFNSAIECFQEALDIQNKSISNGEINSDVSKTYVNLGRCYFNAYSPQTKSPKIKSKWKSFFSRDMLEHIASAHSERGEYMMAIKIYQEVLTLHQVRSSVQTNAKLYNLLGEAFCNTGQYEMAKQQHSRALEAIHESKTPDQLEFCYTQSRMAVVDYHTGKFKESVIQLEYCVEVLTNILGDNHPQLAKVLFHLGVAFRMQYNLRQAYQFSNQALVIQKSTLHPHHQDVIFSEVELGKILLEQNHFEEAREILDRAYTKQLHVYSLDDPHPNLALCLHYLGVCHSLQDNDKKAMKYYEHAYRMYKKLHYGNSLLFALTLDEIALMLIKMGKFEKASSILEDSLRIRDGISENHFECCYSLLGLGVLLTNQLNYTGAIHMFEKAHSLASSSFGLHHPFVADIYLEMGIVHTRRCQFEEGKMELEKAIQIYRTFQFAESHVKLKKATDALSRNLHEEGLCV